MPKARQPLDGSEIPQANQLSRVLDMLRAASIAEPLGPELATRDRAYYVHASLLLGLLDADEEITPLGRVLVGLESEPVRTAVLCEAFRQTQVVQRWMSWARVTRVSKLDPATAEDFLVDESNLGVCTAHRRALTLRKWWLELCGVPEQRDSVRPLPPAATVPPAALAALDWDDLGAALASRQGEFALNRLELPARMRTFIESEELETVGDLMAFRREELVERPNLGRKSIEDTRQAIALKLRELADGETSPDRTFELDAHANLFALVRAQLAQLAPQHRMILTHRIGANGRAMTLEELGSLLGVTRERVRQLERDALNKLRRDDRWLRALEERLAVKLSSQAILLSELARDRWFAEANGRVAEVRFVVERLLESKLRVFDIGQSPTLAAAEESEVRDAEQRLRGALRGASYPLSVAAYDALVSAALKGLPEGVAQLIAAHFDQDVQRAQGPGGDEIVAFGASRQNQVLAYVRASEAPVLVRELEERFGRGALPTAVVHVGRGQVWVSDRVPGFTTWQERLTPMCIARMQQEDAERQWAAYELLEELRSQAQIPDWLTHWHLSSMLRVSGQLLDLGRLRFRLAVEAGAEGRVYVREIAIEELASAGVPLRKEELVARVKLRGAVSDLAVGGLLSRLPFVMVAKDQWGLVQRDVPGGAEAFADAMQAVEDALRQRERGFSSVESTAFVRALSPAHARWTGEMVRSLARVGAVLRGAANGAIGLAEWDEVRVLGQAAIMREVIDAGGGRATIEAVQRRIAEVHGVAPSAPQVANLAQSAEARVRGGEVLDVTLTSRVSVPTSPCAFSVNEIPGVPDASKPLLAEILRQPSHDPDDMRRRVSEHVARFEDAARSNEFLDVREARQLAMGCNRLLDLLPDLHSQTERALICAAVEYFVAPVDSEADLEIGGLDDDLAVFNAIAAKLRRDDYKLEV